ncbi:DUF6292 family protein [Amycolatopsis regifaucium]|uniref:DUF6292 domain-containing protein n=1 Tax=Amycolatopsis regifaucium TaxID=546365 RepID=A0A154MNA1_9PSEU|nr:DUF6292 family protein [Amycolatopsis regifaucium]KZB85808.1 hypothetical protein AVL48_30660 [Amycolatopsis regifaucium]OKA10437.1 hypothetical protein ATP06_0203245 [Amycolatopsis regifaucium]SFI76883.1 hypothetical protein SAMN04489731_11317 [Amycolatopsis regifaucium]
MVGEAQTRRREISLLTGIELDHDLRCGLAGYLVAVSAAVGAGKESWAMDLDHPASAYIALDQRLPRHPVRDTALLWDERHGWAFTMETHSGEDLLVLAYFGGDLVPSPDAVGRFVTAIQAAGGASTVPVLPEPRADRDDVKARLLRYRRDIWAATAPRSHSVISPVCS